MIADWAKAAGIAMAVAAFIFLMAEWTHGSPFTWPGTSTTTTCADVRRYAQNDANTNSTTAEAIWIDTYNEQCGPPYLSFPLPATH